MTPVLLVPHQFTLMSPAIAKAWTAMAMASPANPIGKSVAKGTPFATSLVRSAEQTTEKPPLRLRWSRSSQQANHSGLCLTPFLIRAIKALTKITDRPVPVA